jgi:ATP-dependent exoDNAse (exonuclease V) alpha subunit
VSLPIKSYLYFQIGGITLHAFAGIGAGTLPVTDCVAMVKKKRGVADVWKKCKHLIIDEISMVDGRFFEKLEAIAREVRGNERPFGGIQECSEIAKLRSNVNLPKLLRIRASDT